ncbi:MAG: hypothetical protein VB062_01215 [Christensenella sp.]|nr:hypothetical protein [Christensenella sp.]
MERNKTMNLLPNPRSRSERAAQTLGAIAMGCALLVALALALTSLFAAARISPDPECYRILQIDIFEENELTNLLIVLLGVAAIALIGRFPVTRRFNLAFGSAALLLLGVFGVVWVMSVNARAESDGDVLIRIAGHIVAGDYALISKSGEYLHYYLVQYPYQCGLLACLEILVRFFGETGALLAARLINVFLLISSYAALLLTTERLFHNEHVTFLSILLLCAGIQPLISCTFVYGLIPALALKIWGVYFVVRFLQEGGWQTILPAALFFALAAFVRSNVWIVIVAVTIVLLLNALRKKALLPILFAALIVALSLPLPYLSQKSYEAKLNTSFGSGYPKSYWAAMSLQNGWKASGWHVFAYQSMMKKTYGEDVSAIDRQAKADLAQSIQTLMQNPEEGKTYLFEKMVSQWDEPTFMSVWITKSVEPYAAPGRLTDLVYSEAFDSFYRFAEGALVKILYFGFLLCTASLLRRRTEEQMLLPLILLGGVLFHMIFEAKSQYVLEYLPFFVPLAAYGAWASANCVGRVIKQRMRKGGGQGDR